MSGFVGIRKNAWDAASPVQKKVVRVLWNALRLGEPTLGSVGAQEWYVWHDTRIDPEFVENLGWLLDNIAGFTSSPNRASDGDYIVDEDADPLSAAAGSYGNGWFAAAGSLPVGWSPSES